MRCEAECAVRRRRLRLEKLGNVFFAPSGSGRERIACFVRIVIMNFELCPLRERYSPQFL